MIRADVCIVGAGPAGLTVADELRDSGLRVVVLESGRHSSDGGADLDSQDLSRGVTAGVELAAFDLRATRHRQVGGNANIWSVKTGWADDQWVMGLRYGALLPSDLTSRAWIPNSGWPIGFDALQPYYQRAQEKVASPPAAYEWDDWRETRPPVPFPSPTFDHRVFQFGPSSAYVSDMVERIDGSEAVRLIPEATVTELVRVDRRGPITAARFERGDGIDEVQATTFVLACGAVENARLLLVSDRDSGGVGNESDLVGRFFMDHPLFHIGDLVPASPSGIGRAGFYDFTFASGRLLHGHAVPSPETAAELELLGVGISLFPRPTERQYRAVLAAKDLVENRPGRNDVRRLAADVRAMLGGVEYLPRVAWTARRHGQSMAPGYGRGGWSGSSAAGMRFTRMEVLFQCEQGPDAANRVVLDHSTDRAGHPRPQVQWKAGEQVRHTVTRTRELVASAAVSTGFGRFVAHSGDQGDLPRPASMAHHAGTTRMGLSPDHSVVDPSARVHSVPNLFVAGASVFPTAGYVNPTLTVVALSIRLADRIQRRTAPIMATSPTSDAG